MRLCGFDVGLDRPLFLIAGPDTLESEQLCLDVAGKLKEHTRLKPMVEGWREFQKLTGQVAEARCAVCSAAKARVVIVGAEGGYVGRDGQMPEGEDGRVRTADPPPG